MNLSDLICALSGETRMTGVGDQEITGIASDSRRVRSGDLFVSIAGARVDGHRFIGQAVAAGARAVVAEREISVPAGVGLIIVPDARFALSALADRLFGSPSRRLKMVGITGTNGKTTIAFLVKAVAEAAGQKPGVIGTAGMMLGDEVLEAKSGFTTPEAPAVQRLLSEMVARGGQVAAMEVTSHALEQHRVAHCRFDVGVYTNLTHEHLDYHADMESYFDAKAQLFQLLRPGATAVINLDDPYGARMAERVPSGVQILTYGFSPNAVVRAEAVQISASGAAYRLVTPAGEAHVEAPHLFGTYNVSNGLAAIAVGIGLGYGLGSGVAAMRSAKGAPGRFQRVDCGQDFTVVVDYAHTPDGFEKVLQDVDKIRKPGSRVTMVFGSAGHRDTTKRPTMGRIAGHYCDALVLTEEDPRSESAREISRQIAGGVQRREVDVRFIEDRVSAIEYAIANAKPGDVVLITGKGNETELEVEHPTAWQGDVPAAEDALRRLLADPSRRSRVTA